MNNAFETLSRYNIKPSPQRMAIMTYLLEHKTHPTIEEIYKSLSPDMPTLSKTTIYNTLKLFVENGAASMLTINEKTTCYDYDTSPHAHFICKKCNKVTDLFYGVENMIPSKQEIEGNRIVDMQVYYRGICKDCLKENK
ncbi:MAG TPA: transcriptional repressor [Candidatus Avibacteroides excrementipullorum]|jgi:Fur family ferric uptake transcriptional regulator/Fur family peroxide stress response transcriptional regulator|nr:transcriptional repressor [Candidatus Avibacteroides excrementipullorum]